MEGLTKERMSINLVDLISLKPEALQDFHSELKRTGWVMINMESGVHKKFKEFSAKVDKFFSKKKNEKESYEYSKNYGYVSNAFKEAFRWLSGSLLIKDEVPAEFSKEIKNNSTFFDVFFSKLANAISEEFFNVTAKELGENYKLPLLMVEDKKTNQTGFGMLDVVKYSTGKIEREMMVEGHYDPGLFSFSVYSNAPGLEMFDQETEEWVPIPIEKGVIWTGLAAIEASSQTLKGGYHRVQPHSEYPRMTMWYELCSKTQLMEENLSVGMKRKDTNTSVSTVDSEYSENKDKAFNIIVRSTFKQFSFKVLPQTKIFEIKSRLEITTGRPFSKSIITAPRKIQSIKHKNVELLNDKTVSDYSLKEGDIIDFV